MQTSTSRRARTVPAFVVGLLVLARRFACVFVRLRAKRG
jgi:hypothetical protein